MASTTDLQRGRFARVSSGALILSILVVACTSSTGGSDDTAASSTSDDSPGDDGDTTGGDEPRPPCSFAERFDEGPYPPTIDDPFPPTVVDEWTYEGCPTTGNGGKTRTSSPPPCGDPCYEAVVCLPDSCYLGGKPKIGAIRDGLLYFAPLPPDSMIFPVFDTSSGFKLEHRPLLQGMSWYSLSRHYGSNDDGIFFLRSFLSEGGRSTTTNYVASGRIDDVASVDLHVKGSETQWPLFGFVDRAGQRYVIGNRFLDEVCTFDANDPSGPVEQLAPLGDEWIPFRGINGIVAGDDVVYAGTIRYVPSTDEVFPWWTNAEDQTQYVEPVVLEGDFDSVVCTQRRWEIASGGYEIRGVNCFDGSTAELVYETDYLEQYWRNEDYYYDDYVVDAHGRLIYSTATDGVAFPATTLWRWDPATNTTEVLATHGDFLRLVGTHEDRVYVIRGDNNGCVESFLAP